MPLGKEQTSSYSLTGAFKHIRRIEAQHYFIPSLPNNQNKKMGKTATNH
jgi:hypothetical protein